MSVLIDIFEIVRFKIKIIFCEIKMKGFFTAAEWQFTIAELIILNVLEWEWVFSKINIWAFWEIKITKINVNK